MGERAGVCQECGANVQAYTVEATRLEIGGRRALRKILPPPTAEPCGHAQARAIFWPAQALTYAPSPDTEGGADRG